MDVIFLDTLPRDSVARIKVHSMPLYLADMRLFECPLIVGRGGNAEMPAAWNGAIICCYIAALNHEEALITSVKNLRLEGYEFKTVHEGRIHQLDPSNWWMGLVMEKWSSYADHFPSQGEIDAFVLTGGYFKGPALEWDC